MVVIFSCWDVLKVIWLESAARRIKVFMMNSRKKQGIMPCFFVAQISVSVLMSCRVVTKTNLGNVDSRVRSSLVNECTVKAAGLANVHNGFFTVPLIKCCTVAKTFLGQVDFTVIRTLTNVSAVTATGLANIQRNFWRLSAEATAELPPPSDKYSGLNLGHCIRHDHVHDPSRPD
jgi:hypothetical protein